MCIAIIDFGMGNIHSIQKATRMFAANVQYTADSEVISAAKAIILPGDGAFPAAMQGLSRELATLLKQKIAAECPILGICIGFQILFQDSNEFQEQQVIPGLAMLPGKIRKFQLPSARSDRSPNTLPSARSDRSSNTLPSARSDRPSKPFRIPHMGWNTLQPTRETRWCRTLPHDYAYFIHSCRAVDVPEEYVVAYSRYAEEDFPAIVEKGRVLATQFHPEKSSTYGLTLIKNWVASI